MASMRLLVVLALEDDEAGSDPFIGDPKSFLPPPPVALMNAKPDARKENTLISQTKKTPTLNSRFVQFLDGPG